MSAEPRSQRKRTPQSERGIGPAVPHDPERRGLLGQLAALAAATLLRPTWTFAQNAIEGLRRLQAEVISRADAKYERWRAGMTWYFRKSARYPDAMVLVESVDDVIQAVNHARRSKLKVVSRGTGHASNQTCLRQGGLLLDLSRLQRIQVDPDSQTAWVEPGVRGQDLIAATEPHGLAFPVPHTGFVGLSGFLLGGGLGWNSPKWGVACGSIIEAQVVTADGQLVTCSERERSDLFWSLRGAGPGFFGVVVRFRLRLYPLPKTITASSYVFSEQQIPALAAGLEALMRRKDPGVEAMVALRKNAALERRAPGMSDDGVHCSISLVAFAHTEAQADAMLNPFEESTLMAQAVVKRERTPWEFRARFDAGSEVDAQSPRRTHVDNMWIDNPGETLRAYAELLKDAISPHAIVLIDWGMNMKRNPVDMSLPSFAEHYVMMILLGDSETDVKRNEEWMRRSDVLVRKMAKGHYINETEYQLFPERIPACFTARGWKRLGALRRKYDPEGVFHGFLGY